MGRLINRILRLFGVQISRVNQVNKNLKDKRQEDKSILYKDKQAYLEDVEFKYILWLDRVYEKIREIPGHVVELGVAYGRNAIIFSHLMEMNGEGDLRRYYGFDTFSGYSDKSLVEDQHLSGSAWKSNSKEFVLQRLEVAGVKKKCTLIEGDIEKTLGAFLDETPNLRIALLYVDCNAYSPAKFGMNKLKEFMSPGGIICIDEKKQGGETRALIEFCEENGLEFRKDRSPFSIPAYTKI